MMTRRRGEKIKVSRSFEKKLRDLMERIFPQESPSDASKWPKPDRPRHPSYEKVRGPGVEQSRDEASWCGSIKNKKPPHGDKPGVKLRIGEGGDRCSSRSPSFMIRAGRAQSVKLQFLAPRIHLQCCLDSPEHLPSAGLKLDWHTRAWCNAPLRGNWEKEGKHALAGLTVPGVS